MRKGILSVVAIFLILQMYFVRELLAAELLFGLGFAVLTDAGRAFLRNGNDRRKRIGLGRSRDSRHVYFRAP